MPLRGVTLFEKNLNLNNQMSTKMKLILMNFLEFAVWGAYLTSMGSYLGKAGFGNIIGWFYSIQGIVSIFMPALMGIVADRWMQAQRLLSLCHLLAGVFMGAAGIYGMQDNVDRKSTRLNSSHANISYAVFCLK